MSLSSGSRLGPYEILSALGSGGMGEVYRARDTKLHRDVALKILPDAFARDPDRLARFQREAHVLASLNHPHIAAIYGLEDAEGVTALVMELVEGEDLSQRIARGAMPIDEALPIAKQIAEALEAAHEQGIIHRDLKPANIKVRADGTVKVLDFGLAKLAPQASGSGLQASGEISQSPTITSPAMTQAGMILGTAAYMSPEQARGKIVDKRADIWAFGCVLYEMLTGQRAFKGEEISDVLAAVLRQDVDWAALPGETSARLLRLLTRALNRDPKQRLRDIGEARIAIDSLLGGAPEDIGASVAPGAAPHWYSILPWVLVALVSGLAAVLLVRRPQPAPTGRAVRFVMTTPANAPVRSVNQPAVAISPDGSRVVYRSSREEQGLVDGLVYMRALDQAEAVPLRGADAAFGTVFSRDGTWIIFSDIRDGALKRIPVAGGSPQTVCSLDGGLLRGMSSGPGDTIVFTTDRSHGLLRVSAAGGTPERLTTVDPAKGETDHRWPDVLPDGRAVLFTAWNTSLERARVAVVSLPSGEVTPLLDGTSARFSPTGHLVFAAADGTLRAVGFDARHLQVIGNPVTVVERVGVTPVGGAHFAFSDSGLLVYTTGSTGAIPRTLVWVDRSGHEEPITARSRAYTYVRLSPDGKRAALDSRDEQNDIWIWDFARSGLQRLTNDPGRNRGPVWTPDGTRVAFTAEHDGVESVYWQAADGSGTMERLSIGTQIALPQSFSPDGAQLIFATPLTVPYDLGVLSLGSPHTTATLLHSTANEINGEISPDGRWLAYQSDESGSRSEVYVRPFPHVERAKYQVSTGGGTRPLWSRSGRELFYYAAPDTIMAVPVRLGADVALGTPQPVVKGPYAIPVNDGRHYDVSLDGQRFLLLKDAPTPDGQQTAEREIHVVLNWFEELRVKVPTGK